MPVVGNGDIDSAETAVARLRESGVDGVMIAREALSRPWIFAQVAAVKRSVSRMPVVGNGDVDSAETAVRRLRESGVDGVMIAREALAKPWIFAQAAALLRGEQPPPDPSLDEQREIVLHHYDLVCRRFGVERGTLLMRKFACAYAQGLPGAREFRGRVSRVVAREEFLEVVRDHFPR